MLLTSFLRVYIYLSPYKRHGAVLRARTFRVMSLLKLPFILLDVIGMHITATPPNPPLPVSEHIIPDWREKLVKSLARPCYLLRVRFLSDISSQLTHGSQSMYRLICFIEVLVILASRFPSNPLARCILATFMFNGAAAQHLKITPLYLFGNLVGVLGTVLRVSCYRTLGRLFTFELSIKKNHTLIVTGPYAVIRHPSYTGLIMTLVGACCSQMQGSWVQQNGLSATLGGRILIALWLSIAGAVAVSLLLRTSAEDKLLHSTFGSDWEEWANRVHYKLIPGLY
jgi:protein-S-isoprenylcysteine O-methyltransferase Ste14